MAFDELTYCNDLHDLLHHSDERAGRRLRIRTRASDDGYHATLWDEEQPNRSVQIRRVALAKGLRHLLGCYPAPVFVDGRELDRQAFEGEPAVRLIRNSATDDDGEEGETDAGHLLVDGLRYHVAISHNQFSYVEQDGHARVILRCQEKFEGAGPDEGVRYLLTHNLRRVTEGPAERAGIRFMETWGRFLCDTGSSTTRAMQPQIEMGRQMVREHARERGITLAEETADRDPSHAPADGDYEGRR